MYGALRRGISVSNVKRRLFSVHGVVRMGGYLETVLSTKRKETISGLDNKVAP